MANNAYNNNAAAGHFDPFSAIDFKRFCFLSILTIYIHTVTLKIDPFPIRRIELKEGQNSMTLHTRKFPQCSYCDYTSVWLAIYLSAIATADIV